jgi:hypothetical protein
LCGYLYSGDFGSGAEVCVKTKDNKSNQAGLNAGEKEREIGWGQGLGAWSRGQDVYVRPRAANQSDLKRKASVLNRFAFGSGNFN